MAMNNSQRKILIGGLLVFLFLGLFPPWVYTFNAQSVHAERPAYYAFIALPPNPERDAPAFGVSIDMSRLVIQWFVLAAAVGFGVFITRTKTGVLRGSDEK